MLFFKTNNTTFGLSLTASTIIANLSFVSTMIATTTRPEILDPALLRTGLRAGRFDRQVLVDRQGKIGCDQIIYVTA